MEIIRYIGIDWGESRIGTALGDSETKIATPFKTAKTLEEVIQIINEENVDVVVIGAPLPIYTRLQRKLASGQDSQFPTSNKFENFYNELKSKINIPVERVDERLTTREADAMIDHNKKANANQDEIAAMLILQTFLDKLSNSD